VTTSRSQRKRDDHGNDRKLRSMRRSHHSPRKSNRRTHADLGIGSIPSVSPARRKRRRPEVDILQGKLKKKLSHQLLMVSIGKGKRLRPNFWK
jgi:hypothetical protein